MDWSCCLWRSSSEMTANEPSAAVPVARGDLMGVLGVDLFFWREWSSSIVFAFIGVALSSWHTNVSLLLLFVWILGSPFRPVLLALLVKLNSPFSAISSVSLSLYIYRTRHMHTHSVRIKLITLVCCEIRKRLRNTIHEKLQKRKWNLKTRIRMNEQNFLVLCWDIFIYLGQRTFASYRQGRRGKLNLGYLTMVLEF